MRTLEKRRIAHLEDSLSNAEANGVEITEKLADEVEARIMLEAENQEFVSGTEWLEQRFKRLDTELHNSKGSGVELEKRCENLESKLALEIKAVQE